VHRGGRAVARQGVRAWLPDPLKAFVPIEIVRGHEDNHLTYARLDGKVRRPDRPWNDKPTAAAQAYLTPVNCAEWLSAWL